MERSILTEFVLLTEENDWEGETWNFFLQWDGNKDQLQRLAEDIKRAEFETQWQFPFSLLSATTVTEDEVDTVIRFAADDTSYMNAWQKVTGTFTWPTRLDAADLEEKLYKGGICDFFKET
jgi:hypothetical protein